MAKTNAETKEQESTKIADKVKANFKRMSLAQMRSGQKGKIVQINGGAGLAQKLDALGIRVGKQVEKVSEQWIKGPVLLRQDHTQAALGFGMASKVEVEVVNS